MAEISVGSTIESGISALSDLQDLMQTAMLDLATVVTSASAGFDGELTDLVAHTDGEAGTGDWELNADGEAAIFSLTGNEYGTGGDGLMAGDALLVDYDKNFISQQAEMANVMGKAITEIQSNMAQRLQYLAR